MLNFQAKLIVGATSLNPETFQGKLGFVLYYM